MTSEVTQLVEGWDDRPRAAGMDASLIRARENETELSPARELAGRRSVSNAKSPQGRFEGSSRFIWVKG